MIKEHFALKGYIEKHFGVKVVAKTFRAGTRYFVLEKSSYMTDSWWELRYDTAFSDLDSIFDKLHKEEMFGRLTRA